MTARSGRVKTPTGTNGGLYRELRRDDRPHGQFAVIRLNDTHQEGCVDLLQPSEVVSEDRRRGKKGSSLDQRRFHRKQHVSRRIDTNQPQSVEGPPGHHQSRLYLAK